jgi:hypothetical protein
MAKQEEMFLADQIPLKPAKRGKCRLCQILHTHKHSRAEYEHYRNNFDAYNVCRDCRYIVGKRLWEMT